MSITHGAKVRSSSRDDFHALDYKVMGLAFSIHNKMGRFWDERIYRKELARRCREAGIDRVLEEVPITVSYQGFNKLFRADLLIEDAAVYELKAVQSLNKEHRNQALNCVFLLGIQCGKLINFRPASVEQYYVTTAVTPGKRYDFVVNDLEWQNLSQDCLWPRQFMIDLLKEWGAFLDNRVFYEAVCYFRGGEESVVQPVEVMSGSHSLGQQKVHLLNPEIAFKISSVTKDENGFGQHLHRFVQHTRLRAIQWVNFNHGKIAFKTISR